MKWNCLYSSITALLLTCSSSCFSTSESANLDPFLHAPGNWFISIGGGVQYPQWNNHMKVNNDAYFTEDYERDLYSTEKKSESVFAMSVGRRWQRDNYWFPSYSLGLFWQHFFRTQLGNKVYSFSDSEFNNYKYNWELTANVLLASAKVNLLQYGRFSPYIYGGIGSSFNRTSDYKELALDNTTPRESPKFSNFSTSEFAYHVGAGVDFLLSPKWTLSVGYNYQDLGQISSGPGKEVWSNQALTPGSYHSNEVLVTLNYHFGKENPPDAEK